MNSSQIKYPDKLIYHDADLGFIILETTGKNVYVEMFTVDDNISYPSYDNLIS